MDDFLASLLIDLSDVTDDEAWRCTFDTYGKLYLDRGTTPRRTGATRTHDGEKVVFFEDRFVHAFSETVGWYQKGKFDPQRGSRVAWIGPVIQGRVSDTECWLVPPKNGGRRGPNRRPNRAYIVRSELYVVWLEPLGSGDWKFSSAYVAGPGDIRRYGRDGRLFWAQKNTP